MKQTIFLRGKQQQQAAISTMSFSATELFGVWI